MKQQHSRLIDAIQLAVGKAYPTEVLLFANPVGQVRTSSLYRALLKLLPEKVLRPLFVRHGMRPEANIKFGLCKGSSDLIGCAYGTFLALEAKVGDDTLRPEQKTFFEAVHRVGGLAREVRSVEDAVEAIRECARRRVR